MKKLFHICILALVLDFACYFSVLAQWTRAKLSQPRASLAATGVGNKVFFAGGRSASYSRGEILLVYSNRVDIFDISTKTSSTTVLSQARYDLVATSLGNKAFFAGGSLSDGGPFSDRVDIYDDATGLWTTTTLSQARSRPTATSVGTKVFFAGGFLVGNKYSDVVDIYDMVTGAWSTATLSVARGGVVATSIGTKAFFAAGLQTDLNGNVVASQTIDIYDTATGLWTTKILPRGSYSPVATSVGTKAFFANANNVVDIYDDATNTWSTANLSQSRSGLTATNVGTKAFFAGGTYQLFGVYSTSYSSAVDIYDNATNQWTTETLSQPRFNLASTSLADYAFFGGGDYGFLASSDVVDIYSKALPLALPVNLVSFTGKWIEKTSAQLNWQTSLEKDNDHFQIQRSPDAKSFETIGRVPGKGTTNERTEYSFIDTDIADPISYYRLKQVDLDGSAHFSNIISVSRQKTEQPASLLVWPSPAIDKLTIQLSAGKTIREISVYDLQGRRLSTQISSRPTTDVSGLQTGAYVLDVLTSDGQHIRSRFVKQ